MDKYNKRIQKLLIYVTKYVHFTFNLKCKNIFKFSITCDKKTYPIIMKKILLHYTVKLGLNTYFLHKCLETSDFLNPSRLKRRFARREADGISMALGL